jgi:hypothetical protein
MRYLPGMRSLALVAGLLFAGAGSALAQDTSQTGAAPLDTAAADTSVSDTASADTSAVRDTTDTSGVQNPPGYRGMERDTTAFPDSGTASSASPGAVEDATTGTYDDSNSHAGHDSTTVGDTEPTEETSATPRIDPSDSTQ